MSVFSLSPGVFRLSAKSVLRGASAALLFLSVFLWGNSSAAETSASFFPVASLPSYGYVLGTAKIIAPSGETGFAPAVRRGAELYLLVSSDDSQAFLPPLSIQSVGFFKNYTVVGANESADGRKAWILLFSLESGYPRFVDAVKYAGVDGYDYDFYYGLPSAKVPGFLTDQDRDGFPEVTLDFYLRKFRMFLEVRENGLRLDLSSPAYADGFAALKKIRGRDEYQFREFLIYGVLSGAFSEEEAVNKFLGRNASERGAVPEIIEKAVNLKKAADSMDAADVLAAYFSSEIEASDMAAILEKEGKDAASFMFGVFDLEKDVSALNPDEVAFNDFVTFFSGGMTEKEFRRIAPLSVASGTGDIYSVLTNYRGLDAALHSAGALKFVKYSVK